MHWWEHYRKGFDLCTSQLVVDEARCGDLEVAQRRLELLDDMSFLEVTDQARTLAMTVVQEGLLSQRAFPDALHIAIATAHQVDYLVTWNSPTLPTR